MAYPPTVIRRWSCWPRCRADGRDFYSASRRVRASMRRDEGLYPRDVVVCGELHRPAVFERPEIRLGRFERRAGFAVAVVDRHLDGRVVASARVELQEIERLGDKPQALDRLLRTAAGSAQRVEVDWNVDHVTEVVGQVGCQPVEILRPPSIVDGAKDRSHPAASSLRGGNAMEGTLVNLIVQIIAGAIGGTAAGSALKDLSMGKAGDAISGAVGGGVVGQILMAVLGGAAAPDAAAAAGGLDIGGIVKDLVGGGVGGAVVMAIIGAVRNAMAK